MGPAAKSRSERPDTQPSISGAFARCTKYKKGSERWNACTDAVTKYICKEMVSCNTVEKQSFKDLLTTLDCQYEVPGRTYFSTTAIPRAYTHVRSELQRVISAVEHFSFTTDMWSSTNMTPYMSLTLHFIDTEWTLVSKCLQTSFLPEDHTTANLALQEALQEWGIDEAKVSCLSGGERTQ
ncbi:Zinc finger BED domain-containing protein 1 [Merluccius polli]|uniref:Zinc finger BED domain-containing protein 1 n=1 Tax=Merluccius polli TaxID=89951 RepID=A0AA47MCZ5_MERPO|nr:Zinc finger BED domain-containing protein 1 [Merluccius polli]